MSETVTKSIVGQCVEITEKNGWTGFSIDVGSQYPVKVSTKVEKVIGEARAIGSEVATWTFKESDGNENPNKPGTFYKNRWLDKVEAGEHAPAADTAGGTSTPAKPLPEAHHEPIAPADKDRAIVRQACLKAAGALFTAKGNVEKVGDDGRDNVAELLAAADRMERWVYRDIDEVPF
jgi:hypothetical protein